MKNQNNPLIIPPIPPPPDEPAIFPVKKLNALPTML